MIKKRIALFFVALLVFGSVMPCLASDGDEPIARFVVLTNPYITTLKSDQIEDERGANRGFLEKLAAPSLSKSIAKANRLKPDAMIIMGDLTWTGSEADFAAFDELLSAAEVPVMLTPGLRDAPDGKMDTYLKHASERDVHLKAKMVSGVRLLFAGNMADPETIGHKIQMLNRQATGEQPKATLLFGGRQNQRGTGPYNPSSVAYWDFIEKHKVAVRLEPTRYSSRMSLEQTLPVYVIGSTAWTLRETVTHLKVYADRVVVEKVAAMGQPAFHTEFPNPVAGGKMKMASDDPFASPSYSADLKAGPKLTFAVASDPQVSIGRQRSYLVRKAEEVIADLNRLKPAHVFIPGDLVEDNLPDEWELINQLLAELTIPYTVMPGNHDVMFVHDFVEDMYQSAKEKQPEAYEIVKKAQGKAIQEGYTGSTALYEKYMNTPPRQVVKLGDCVFICMEILTQRIEPSEIDWLKQQLKATRGAKHVFVLGHYPVLPAFGNNVAPDQGGDDVLALLKKYEVAGFIFGHRHNRGFRMHDGTAHILADNMKSSVLIHVFDDRLIIANKSPGSPLYEKVVVPEPRAK